MKIDAYSGEFSTARGTLHREVEQLEHEEFIPNDEVLEAFNKELEKLKRDSEIIKAEPLDVIETRDGRIDKYGFILRSGFTHAANFAFSRNPITDVPGLETTALFTSIEGMNEDFARNCTEAGSHYLSIGAEGSYHTGKLSIPRRRLSLARSSAAVLSISNYAGEKYGKVINPVDRYLVGKSRGSMAGKGILAMDKVFDQNILFADLLAACYPRPFKFSTDILMMGKQFLKEPKSAVSFLGKLSIGKLWHYPATLDPHFYAIAHQIATIPALINGDSGEMAKLIQESKAILVRDFEDDYMSMPEEWDSIYKDHPNVRTMRFKGGHSKIPSPEVQASMVDASKAFQVSYLEKGKDLTIDDVVNQLLAA